MTLSLKADALADSVGTLAKQLLGTLIDRSPATESAAPARGRGDLPPVLLTMPNNHGTLAAARSLGRRGVRVTTADPSPIGIASSSRYTQTNLRCPPVRQSEEFLEWLLAFGARNERHVLLATCDDTVWLYAKHSELLSRSFYLPKLDVGVLHQLLNKRLMSEHARQAGLDTPRAWFPADDAELQDVAREAQFPVLLKPITQVFFLPRHKGFCVHSAEDLLRIYPSLARHPYGKTVRDYDDSVTRPMVQEYYADAASNGVYSISGYVRDGRVLAPLAARKVLQWPRRLGVGVCFEEAPLNEALVAGLEQLVQRVGFHGTFEAEFLQAGERRVLIDFNPRFYNQMGFDVARGSALPILAYEDAIGRKLDPPSVGATAAATLPRIYVHGSALRVMLGSQRVSGALSATEHRHWTDWYARHEGERVDAVVDADDRVPALVDAALLLKACARHPLHFLKDIVLNT